MDNMVGNSTALKTSRKTDLNIPPVFIEVFSYASVTKAASSLGVSASSVSQTLNKLREHFSDPLFLRDGQHLVPTAKATAIFEILQDDVDKLTSSMEYITRKNPPTDKMIVNCSPYLSVRLLPGLSAHIWEKHPGCEIVHKSQLSETRFHDNVLRVRKMHMLFDFHPNSNRSMTNIKILDEALCFVCAKTHPRLGQEISSANCTSEQYAILDMEGFNFTAVQMEVQNLIGEGRSLFKSNSFFALLSLIESTDCVGVLPV